MNDDAKLIGVIRINIVSGIVMLGLLVLAGVLILAGALPLDTGRAIRLTLFGGVPLALAFVTAWTARRDLLDPAGRERRYQKSAVVLAAGVVGVGLVAVVGTIVWGLAGTT